MNLPETHDWANMTPETKEFYKVLVNGLGPSTTALMMVEGRHAIISFLTPAELAAPIPNN